MFDHPEVQLALRDVRQASQLAAQVQAEMVSPALTKEDRSPVTVADFAVQALVAGRLEEALPDDRLVAEECADALREPASREQLDRVTWFLNRHLGGISPDEVCRLIDRGTGDPCDRFWTLDPIDGTKGFLRGDQYAVALALIERGEVVLGVLGCPRLCWTADRITQRRDRSLLQSAVLGRGVIRSSGTLGAGRVTGLGAGGSSDGEAAAFL